MKKIIAPGRGNKIIIAALIVFAKVRGGGF